MQRQYRPPFDELLFHEAGHAVVAIFEGATVQSFTTDPEFISRPGRAGEVQITMDREIVPVTSQLLMLQAGSASQIVRRLSNIWDGKSPEPAGWLPLELLVINGGGDAGDFVRVMGRSRREKSAVGTFMAAALVSAIRYVSHPEIWGAISTLAQAARLDSWLEGEQVETIVTNAPRSTDARLNALKFAALDEVQRTFLCGSSPNHARDENSTKPMENTNERER